MIPSITPDANCGGVDSTLTAKSRPSDWLRTTSVKVPPMSTPIRQLFPLLDSVECPIVAFPDRLGFLIDYSNMLRSHNDVLERRDDVKYGAPIR